MKIADPLFQGEHICLAPIDHEKDPEIEAKWTQDATYMRLLSLDPVRPFSAAQLKKKYEAIEKEQDESRSSYYFTIRMREDDRLIGFIHLTWIEWSNGNAWIRMGIGDAEARGHGYGSEALRLILRYAFAELNLYRISIAIPEYNAVALHIAQKAGFVEEVRRRQGINRDGKRWDLLNLGILRQEWEARHGS
jgi:RimJ/RimL family protein N-acetyltransferase